MPSQSAVGVSVGRAEAVAILKPRSTACASARSRSRVTSSYGTLTVPMSGLPLLKPWQSEAHQLMVNGGSDCHGLSKGKPLIGTVKVPYELVTRLRDRALAQAVERGFKIATASALPTETPTAD